MTKTYTSRFAAGRAAKVALGGDAIVGADFRIKEVGAKFSWEEISLTPDHDRKPLPIGDLSALDPAPVGKVQRPTATKRKPAEKRAYDVQRAALVAEKAADRPATPGKRAALLASVEAGKLPEAPSFSDNPTWNSVRKKAAEVTKLIEARDVKGLEALSIPTYDSGVKAVARYRDLAVIALKAQGVGARAGRKSGHEAPQPPA